MSFWETLSAIIRAVLIMSMTGSVVSLLLFALKPIIKNHIPKVMQYYMWLFVLAAFLIPFSTFVSVPVNTPLTPVQNVIEMNVKSNAEWEEQVAQELYGISYEELDDMEKVNVSYRELKARHVGNYDFILTYIPILGVAYFLKELIRYLIYAFKLRSGRLPARKNELALLPQRSPRLYRSSLATTPMLVGLFCPAIYLPDVEYSEVQLQNILRHELTHWRRHDVAVKWIATLAVHIHWFNPFAYFVRREIDRACELACDEAVVNSLDNEGKQSYGDTLIEMAADSKKPMMIVSTTMCEEKKTLKERLASIMHSKKPAKAVIQLSCALLVALLGAIVLVGASSNYNDCSTVENRELRLQTISNLGNETTISQEVVIDDYIISGYTTRNNRYGLAVFAADGDGTYRFQTNINRFDDELVFITATINHKHYNVFWANKADLDYAEVTYTIDGNIGETIKLDAKDNKIIYTDAPSNDFSVEYYFFDINGNRYE